jgi:hypothetical protein
MFDNLVDQSWVSLLSYSSFRPVKRQPSEQPVIVQNGAIPRRHGSLSQSMSLAVHFHVLSILAATLALSNALDPALNIESVVELESLDTLLALCSDARHSN